MKHIHRLILISLISILSLIIMRTIPQYGITIDEPFFTDIATGNAQWILSPSLDTIDALWPIHDRHPPFFKVIAGIAALMIENSFDMANPVHAHRFGTIPFFILLSLSVYAIVKKYTDSWYGLWAVGIVTFLPRLFFHSHIVALDYAVTALWTAVIASILTRKHSVAFPLSLMLTGMALATKIQGVFLWGFLCIYWMIFFLKKGKKSLPLALLSIVVAGVTPLLLFFVLWPYLWLDPVGRLQEYLQLLLDHYPIELYYLHTTYNTTLSDPAPWHYPIILTLVTTPVLILLLMLFGCITSVIEKKRRIWVLIISMLLPLVVSGLPWVLKYDGIRLFMPAIPMLVVFAAIGYKRITTLLPRKLRTTLAPVIGIIVLLSTIIPTIRTHPYQTAYYNILAGGTARAAQNGFEAEYWAAPYQSSIPFIRDHASDTFCVHPWHFFFEVFKRYDYISSEIVITDDLNQCDWLILLSRQGAFHLDDRYWQAYSEYEPVFSVRSGGVRLLGIYAIDEGMLLPAQTP